MTCPSCGASIPQGAAVCGRCGAAAPRERRCPHCQAVVPLNAVVCPACEELIRDPAPSPEPPEDILQKIEEELLPQTDPKPRAGFHWMYLVAAVTIFALGFMLGAITTGSTSPGPAAGEAGTGSRQNGPVSLDGTWKQVNSTSSSSYQAAGISGDRIEIMWIDTETDTQSLYWAGTVEAPEELGSEFTWESVRDAGRTSSAAGASSDSTKVFTYRDGQLRFSASVMGATSLIKMEKISDTPPDMPEASELQGATPRPEPQSSGESTAPSRDGGSTA